MSARRWALTAAATALLGAGCGGSGDGGGGGLGSDGAAKQAPTQTTTTRVEVIRSLGDGNFDPQAIYETEAAGVVTVVSLFGEGGLEALLGGGEEDDEGGGLGSGFVLNGKGEIATNAHVVTQGKGRQVKVARKVFVEFHDGNQVEAKIIGHDPNSDIALLRIDPKGLELHPLPLAPDDEIPVGSPVAALGSPFGQRQSLSVGVVSATDRSISSLTDFRISGAVQTDAAINPGNSGGPLLDAEGRVIGVNQQIQTSSGGGEGVGFAVPVAVVRRSLQQLREHGRARYAYLGVGSKELYPQLVKAFELPVAKGAWVQEVTAGTPAAKAGLKGGTTKKPFQVDTYQVGGDIITKVGKTAVADPAGLATAISAYEPGQQVTIEVYRDGERREVDVKLGDRPDAPSEGR